MVPIENSAYDRLDDVPVHVKRARRQKALAINLYMIAIAPTRGCQQGTRRALTVIPADKAAPIAADKILDSRAVWTNESSDPDRLEAKCCIAGKGFQEPFDETLRRDSH